MAIKNTAENYGTVARWLHWVTALLFLASYCSVYYKQWFTEANTPENLVALQLHLSVGITVAVIVALRINWRIVNRSPDAEPGTPLEHLAAHVGHFALYAILIIMPLTGYLGTGGATNYFFMFEIPRFADTQLFTTLVTDGLGLTFKEFEKPIDFIHKEILGKWVVWMLIAGHVLAALYHHYIKRDRTLSKMTTGR